MFYKKSNLLVIILFLIFGKIEFSYSKDIYIPKTINAGIGIELNTPPAKALTEVWGTVFKRVGVETFNVKGYPGKRLSIMLIADEIDFDMWRVRIYDFILLKQGMISDIDKIVKIPEWYGVAGFELFAMDPDKKIIINSGKDLIDSDYKIDYLNGHVWAWYWLPNWVKEKNLHSVREARQSLDKILLGRVDMYCASENTILHIINEKKYRDAGIRKVGRAGITYLTGWFSGKYRDPKYLSFLLKVTDEVSRMRLSGEAAQIALKYGFKME